MLDDSKKHRALLRQADSSFEEYIDISHVFYYKNKLAHLVSEIQRFSSMNHEYLDMLSMSRQDLYPRIEMTKKLFNLNKEIMQKYDEIEMAASEQDYQHMLSYYYHVFYNVNRHVTAE